MMSMRSYLAQSLKDSVGLAALGLIPAGVVAGDSDTVQERPFINLRWQTTNPGIKNVVVRRFLNVWFHDEPNDYSRVDDMVFVVRSLWLDLEGVNHGTGTIMVVEWQSDSPDLSDSAMGTINRFSTYRIIGTEGVA